MRRFIIPAFLLSALLSQASEIAFTAKTAMGNEPLIPVLQQNETPPQDFTCVPYKDDSPEIQPAAWEKAARMILFSRPLTQPVWAENRPLPHERITSLTSWGAEKQFVTLNFAVYPLEELKNLRIAVRGSKVRPEIRLVRYWNVIYPNYNSRKQFRRMPEFLVPSNGLDLVPAREPQRFFLTFQLPENGPPSFSGDILISHDGFDRALRLPFQIRVLPFQLKQDPCKHYSAYYFQIREHHTGFYRKYKGDPARIRKAQINEFRQMLDYGFTRPPTLYLNFGTAPDGRKDTAYISNLPVILSELREAGFPRDSVIPVVCTAFRKIYENYTGLKPGSHMVDIDCGRIPEDLYAYVGKALDRYLEHAKKLNLPQMIYCPVDEPSPQAFPFVKRVYEIFKSRRLKTFITSPPEIYETADSIFDIYCYGSFKKEYETAVSGRKKEYWCYPNDNAYQIKDPAAMCHGGRLAYGLGFWRSGFHMLIPWIWRNHNPRRLCNSGGNLMLDDGSVIVGTCWEAFRLGVDDLRYIYTLQDAVMKRENGAASELAGVIKRARAVLQETWNAIFPQPAYLRDNLMHHAEIDARRAMIANMILELKKYPENHAVEAPSVIIDPKGSYFRNVPAADNRNIFVHRFDEWQPMDREISLEHDRNGWNITVKIDHKNDGNAHFRGKYPVGWPRIISNFGGAKGMDFRRFAYLEFDITAKSDRDMENDYNWPIAFTASSRTGKTASFHISHRLEPGVRKKIRIPLSKFSEQLDKKDLAQISRMQIVFNEREYRDGVTLKLKLGEIRAVGFSAPTITGMDAPAVLALPVPGFSVPASVSGTAPGAEEKITAELLSEDGRIIAGNTTSVINARALCGFPGDDLTPGNYIIRLYIPGKKDGEVISEIKSSVRIFQGPAGR